MFSPIMILDKLLDRWARRNPEKARILKSIINAVRPVLIALVRMYLAGYYRRRSVRISCLGVG